MMERQVRRYASAFGWIDQVCVVRDAQGRLVIELYGEGIGDIQQQGEGFSAGLGALLGVALTRPKRVEDGDKVYLEMRERAPFRAVVGIGRQQKEDAAVSGDTGCYFLTDAGVACLLLADGMGTGAAAAQDSRVLVTSLERFFARRHHNRGCAAGGFTRAAPALGRHAVYHPGCVHARPVYRPGGKP